MIDNNNLSKIHFLIRIMLKKIKSNSKHRQFQKNSQKLYKTVLRENNIGYNIYKHIHKRQTQVSYYNINLNYLED